MDIIKKNKLELERELTFYERESKRSMQWFFLNLLGMIITTGFTLLITPELIVLLFKALIKVTEKKLTPDVMWGNPEQQEFKLGLRIQFLSYLNSFLIFLVFAIGLFWVLFRYRKWTKYSHRRDIIRWRLDNLESKE